MAANVTTIVCAKCGESTGYKSDGRIVFDFFGKEINKGSPGYFLMQGLNCLNCGAGFVWSCDLPQKVNYAS